MLSFASQLNAVKIHSFLHCYFLFFKDDNFKAIYTTTARRTNPQIEETDVRTTYQPKIRLLCWHMVLFIFCLLVINVTHDSWCSVLCCMLSCGLWSILYVIFIKMTNVSWCYALCCVLFYGLWSILCLCYCHQCGPCFLVLCYGLSCGLRFILCYCDQCAPCFFM